ncbi:hypothetical protein BJX68DRAFT_261716 [Aspergillus pseudodeflectus]|uniref:Aminoglycoside phosphotransferase domain-containing protein n=1 Tax=Aspergillus pseudodeflectus TaxID=176178 RepID=A0ABR4L725_9EURO
MISWEDTDGSFCLLADDSELSLSEQPLTDLIYQAGTSSAVWAIGSNAICKVKTWTHGMEMESDTLALVKASFPDIPVPDVIYAWLDEKLSRSFLILKRVQGNTLAQVWHYLTPEKRDGIATTVAQYCSELANLTSSKFQSATGHGVLEPFMNVRAKDSHPSWKPRLLGPMTGSSHQSYLQRISRIYEPPVTATFHFYHADLGPTNVLISDDGKIKSILDWESAGYYPKYWVTLKPYMSLGFCLPAANDRYAWADLLIAKLGERGFVLDMACIEWYKDLDRGYFDTDLFRDD